MSQIKLYNLDCLSAMREMPDKAFELAVVDPPYGINAPYMNMGSMPTRGEISTANRLRGAEKLKDRILNRSVS